ncbi:MAG: YceD family protein [Defluviitaleaceae bacterium]|nr:YceD family protein [Defluviitaleaceae bacterium]
MHISLSGLENNQKQQVEFKETLLVPQEYGLVDCSPVTNFEGIIRKSEDDFLLEGRLQSDIMMSCGKCLQDVDITVSGTVFEKFSTELNADEDAWHIQELSNVDIAPQILLNLQLLIPMNVLCTDDCKGICRYCGKNLNEISCNCDELNREIDPRLEKLKELF